MLTMRLSNTESTDFCTFFSEHLILMAEHFFYPFSDNLKMSPKTPLAVTAEPAPAP